MQFEFSNVMEALQNCKLEISINFSIKYENECIEIPTSPSCNTHQSISYLRVRTIALLLSCIYYSLDIYGQVELVSNNANLINPLYLKDYLNKPALNSRLIGLGEATHGTKEFTEIKSDIVKILVLQYGYKNFILEAGYIDCIKINEFIQNKNDDSLNLFKGLPWPWATTEFYELIKWMRQYNIHSTKDEYIHFYGSDVGNHASVRFYKNQFANPTTNLFIENLIKIYADTLKTPNQKIAMLKVQSKAFPKLPNFTDSMKMKNILESLHFLLLRGGERYKFREITFADLTIAIIDHLSSKEKFILWAHNTHIAKFSDSRKTVAYFLNKRYSEHYTNFIFEFNKGGFRAVDTDSNRYQNNIFKFTNFNVNSDFNKIGSRIIPDSLNYMILDVKSPFNKNLVPKYFYINSIGAVYSKDLAKKKPALYREKIYRNKSCDYLIVVNQTNASSNYFE